MIPLPSSPPRPRLPAARARGPRGTVLRVAMASAMLASAAALAATPGTHPFPEVPPAPALPDVTFPLLRIVGALVFVLALFAAGAWFVRRWNGLAGPGAGRPARLRLLEVRSLGQRQALFVVAYDRQRLLVAASPAGIALLDRLPEATEAEIATLSEPPPSFAEALRRVLPGR